MSLCIGVIGLNTMGRGIVVNFLKHGLDVIVWNCTLQECGPFENSGATVALTPKDVVAYADITFSCVSNPKTAKEMMCGKNGILESTGFWGGRGYVSLANMDVETSVDIKTGIQEKGGRYLVAMLDGSQQDLEDGMLLLVASGDKSLYDDCLPYFWAISRTSFFLSGPSENAAKLYLSLQVIHGNLVAGLAEVMALARASDLNLNHFLEVLQHSAMGSPFLIAKCRAMIKNDFSPSHPPLQHVQRDMGLALRMAELLQHPPKLYFTGAAHQVFVDGMRCGYGKEDTSAIHKPMSKRPVSIDTETHPSPVPVEIDPCEQRLSTQIAMRLFPTAAAQKEDSSALHMARSKRFASTANETLRTPALAPVDKRRMSTRMTKKTSRYTEIQNENYIKSIAEKKARALKMQKSKRPSSAKVTQRRQTTINECGPFQTAAAKKLYVGDVDKQDTSAAAYEKQRSKRSAPSDNLTQRSLAPLQIAHGQLSTSSPRRPSTYSAAANEIYIEGVSNNDNETHRTQTSMPIDPNYRRLSTPIRQWISRFQSVTDNEMHVENVGKQYSSATRIQNRISQFQKATDKAAYIEGEDNNKSSALHMQTSSSENQTRKTSPKVRFAL